MRRIALVPLVLAVATVQCGAPTGGDPLGSLEQANTQQCPTQTVEGVDVSDGQGTIDWAQVKASGREFALIKATQGDYYTAKTFKTNWANAKGAGVLRSAYHFFDPSRDGVAQANRFLAEIGPPQPGDLPPMLDIECPVSGDQATAQQSGPNCEYGGNSGWAPPAVIAQRAFDWLDTVEKATGKKALVYSYPAWFGDVGFTDARLASYPLYIATLSNCASVPPPWTSAVIWQYSFTGNVPGIPGQVDMDRFMGSLADLMKFADSTAMPAAPAPARNGNDALSVVNWPDGHAELFATSPAGELLHLFTGAPASDDSWTMPAKLDVGASCGFAASFWGSPYSYPEVFSARAGGGASHIWWASGKWNTFQDLGGAGDGLAHFSTVVHASGLTEVFALGGDHAIWHDAFDLTKRDWAGWATLGGDLATGAATVLWPDGHAELFATDGAGVAWHDYTMPSGQGGWSGWQQLPGGATLASRPMPVVWKDGHVELFARATDGTLVHSPFAGAMGWRPWSAIGGASRIAGEPSVIYNDGANGGAEGPEVFARDAQTGVVLHLWWSQGAWTDWQPLQGGQAAASDPLAFTRADGRSEVFAVDGAGSLARTYHDPASGWSPWAPIGSGIASCATGDVVMPGGDGGASSRMDGSVRPGGDGGKAGTVVQPGGCGCAVGGARSGRDARGALATIVFGLALALLVAGKRARRLP